MNGGCGGIVETRRYWAGGTSRGVPLNLRLNYDHRAPP